MMKDFHLSMMWTYWSKVTSSGSLNSIAVAAPQPWTQKWNVFPVLPSKYGLKIRLCRVTSQRASCGNPTVIVRELGVQTCSAVIGSFNRVSSHRTTLKTKKGSQNRMVIEGFENWRNNLPHPCSIISNSQSRVYHNGRDRVEREAEPLRDGQTFEPQYAGRQEISL